MMKIIIVPKEELNIIKLTDSIDKVIEIDSERIYKGYVTQFVIDESNRLIGVITSSDIDNMGEKNNIIEIMNPNPTSITEGKFSYDMAYCWLSNCRRINMVPVLNSNGELLYAYQWPNSSFIKYCEHDFDLYTQELLEKTIESIRSQYAKIWLASDSKNLTHEYVISGLEDVRNVSEKDVVIIAYNHDYEAKKIARSLVEQKKKWMFCEHIWPSYYNLFPVSDYYKMDEKLNRIFQEESYANGLYFDFDDFTILAQMIQQTKKIKGDYVEIGVYRGDSARFAVKYMRSLQLQRKVWLLDTYEGFNYVEASESSDMRWQNTHDDTSIELVRKRVKEDQNINIVKSNIITDNLPDEIENIAVCNIDVDLYEAVQYALYKVKNRVVKGGVIIAEDYGHTPELLGAQLAIDEFYEENEDEWFKIVCTSGQCLLIRQ